jgi:hypothetical protein
MSMWLGAAKQPLRSIFFILSFPKNSSLLMLLFVFGGRAHYGILALLSQGPFFCARIILTGIELMHMLRKAQFKGKRSQAPSAAQQFYSLAT